MTAAAMEEKVGRAIAEQSAECERGIVGDRTVNGMPIAAYIRIAPNCLSYVQPLMPGMGQDGYFIDICLN